MPEQDGLDSLRRRAAYRPPPPREGQQAADPSATAARAQRRFPQRAERLRAVDDQSALADEQKGSERLTEPTVAVVVRPPRRARGEAGKRAGEAVGLADEEMSVQLTVRIRPSVEQRLRRCLYQLGETGIRRPTRAELVEAYLAELPVAAGPELDGLVARVQSFRARAPRPR